MLSHLSEFAKELIRDCAKDRLNVYETFSVILKGCPKSGYNIEQVGKYLRRVTKAIIRDENTPPQNVNDVTNYLARAHYYNFFPISYFQK